MSSHLEKTHAKLKEMGYAYAKVEYFNPWSKTTLDLFGLHDTVAIRGDKVGVFGINSCGEDVAPHITKYLKGYSKVKKKVNEDLTTTEIIKEYGPNECLKPWLEAGNRFEIWGWRKRGPKGKRKVWELRRVEFSIFAEKVIAMEKQEEIEDGGEGDKEAERTSEGDQREESD